MKRYGTVVHELCLIMMGCDRGQKGKMDTPGDTLKYFDDEGNEMNPNLTSKPALCVSCVKDEDPNQEMLCNLNRLDQQDEADFKCGAYEPRKEN